MQYMYTHVHFTPNYIVFPFQPHDVNQILIPLATRQRLESHVKNRMFCVYENENITYTIVYLLFSLSD